jgi:hypothetical protein
MVDVIGIRDEIQNLKAKSLLAIDEKRWDDFVGFFMDNPRIDYTRAVRPDTDEPLPIVHSAQGYAAMARAFIGDAKSIHMGSLPIIEALGPDSAKATWKMEDVIVRSPGSRLASRRGYFLYEDEYRLTEAGWRISALTFIPLFTVPLNV